MIFTYTISHVNSQIIQQYDSPHQFEPLMPAVLLLAPLLEKAGDLMLKATALGAASGKTAQTELRKLLRSMNSYYTNRIEGDHTRPSDIERALQQDFSASADLARKQRLAEPQPRARAPTNTPVPPRAVEPARTSTWIRAEPPPPRPPTLPRPPLPTPKLRTGTTIERQAVHDQRTG